MLVASLEVNDLRWDRTFQSILRSVKELVRTRGGSPGRRRSGADAAAVLHRPAGGAAAKAAARCLASIAAGRVDVQTAGPGLQIALAHCGTQQSVVAGR